MTKDECIALKARIDRLDKAYEDLVTGNSARVLVDQNGERIEFTSANAPRLSTYIHGLKSTYGSSCELQPAASSGPMRFMF
ncbi:hypothetical protein LOKG_00022 [Loktanella phage pCB2051-A]|uniref:Head-to-tail joining protein n=1 Tax=Loktanella phage pCB2051-A TaxID=754044 RepID=M4QSY0_9CAUD|nr:head-tail adaptor Ad1 [Loktanella phage pCB2051-A]AGH31459.1 hypothetical protein LOKG_00022 [Loktanella phage pCB2051-A]